MYQAFYFGLYVLTLTSGVSSGGEVSHSEKTMFSTRSKKATMASVFKVLDDPNFHKSVSLYIHIAFEENDAFTQ